MSVRLPYMLAYGRLREILEKIREARRPDRFTLDFLKTILGFRSSSDRPIIPFLKKMGFLDSGGVPTPLYDQFRNEETSGAAVAQGMKTAFSELFVRSEYVYEKSSKEITGLVVQITGAAKEDATTKATVSTFMTLKNLADFESDATVSSVSAHSQGGDATEDASAAEAEASQNRFSSATPPPPHQGQISSSGNLPLNTGETRLQVGYTINLNLPETTDIDVFNAIFKALNEHLLKNP